MSITDRWAADDEAGDGGLQPAGKPLPPIAAAISLAINEDEPEPWDRYMALDLDDDEAVAAWERWFVRWRRARNRALREQGLLT